MKPIAEFVEPDIFTVSNLFSPMECGMLIDRAESIGFNAASVRTRSGPKMMTNVRNNNRVNLTDPDLAATMWVRISSVLPLIDDQMAKGVDSSLRFYRYEPGQEFKRHKDGAVTNENGDVSKLSYLIYLNEDFDGGATTFRDYLGTGGERKKIQHIIQPIAGSALIFRHERWHEGSPVIHGSKYVLRTDIYYGD